MLASMPRAILFYNTMWGSPLEFPQVASFALTTDRKAAEFAAAIVFHLPTLPRDLIPNGLTKRQGQLWIAWSLECEAHYPQMRDPNFMRHFDLTMTYRLDADIAAPYLDSGFRERLRTPPAEKDDAKLVNAFVSSPYNRSRRIEFMVQLMGQIDVHSYGKLFRNRRLEADKGSATKLETIKAYKFTLALENAIAEDYVTEKFYDPLIAGSVPVYLGAPNIDDFAPGENCFINVADWESPAELARHLLELAGDDAAYARFLEWKTKPFRAPFSALLDRLEEHPFVRLCKTVEERLSQRPGGSRGKA
jgi:hypothetical protein